MNQPPVDIVRELAAKLARRGLSWRQAVGAAIHERIVDIVALRTAQVELGDEWASRIYDTAAADYTVEEEISFDDTKVGALVTDDIPTEPGATPYMTVNQFILTVVAMREDDPDIGRMRIVVGDDMADIARIAVRALRQAPTAESDYALLIDCGSPRVSVE